MNDLKRLIPNNSSSSHKIMNNKLRKIGVGILAGLLGLISVHQTTAQLIIPGTGKLVTEVGDDFEDPNWTYHPNLPKVLNNKDTMMSASFPLGISANRRWHEGKMRGQPESVRRVETPAGGIPGSTGALGIRSLQTGGRHPSFEQQQEDFIANLSERIGKISVARGPNIVTRVWLPPIEKWENRTGCHFAFRVGLQTDPRSQMPGGIRSSAFEGSYWPGMFLHLDSKEGRGATNQEFDSANFWIKATDDGQKMQGPQITTTGWWTLGMSISPDGRVHYFAKAGVEDLTAEDHVGSSFPFGYRAQQLRSFFFNVCNGDDGRTWSTEFVIDDPKLYFAR